MKKWLYLLCWGITGFCENTSFVIVIPSYNNARWAEENVKSALEQQYDRFRILYIDDASTDATLSIIESIKHNEDEQNRLMIFRNTKNQGAMKNIYDVVHREVQNEEVVVLLDGDDRLAHNKVLLILDRVYRQKHPIWMTYGSYRWRCHPEINHCQRLPFQWEKTRMYRQIPFVASHLRTFKGWLFKRIRKEDLLYQGEFAPYAWDLALMLPMLEMSSRGHFAFIPTILYDYNDENPISDFRKDRKLYDLITEYFHGLPSYSPL